MTRDKHGAYACMHTCIKLDPTISIPIALQAACVACLVLQMGPASWHGWLIACQFPPLRRGANVSTEDMEKIFTKGALQAQAAAGKKPAAAGAGGGGQ